MTPPPKKTNKKNTSVSCNTAVLPLKYRQGGGGLDPDRGRVLSFTECRRRRGKAAEKVLHTSGSLLSQLWGVCLQLLAILHKLSKEINILLYFWRVYILLLWWFVCFSLNCGLCSSTLPPQSARDAGGVWSSASTNGQSSVSEFCWPHVCL